MNIKRILSAALLTGLCAQLFAGASTSADGAWTLLDSPDLNKRTNTSARKWVDPDVYSAFSVDMPKVTTPAFTAPADSLTKAKGSSVILTVPKPDGTFERFSIVDVPTMEAGLAAQYPNIRTFSGVGLDDPTARLRGDVGPQGFRASVRSDHGFYYVDPMYHGNTDVHISYYLKDSGPETPLNCNSTDPGFKHHDHDHGSADKTAKDAFGTDFRTVRIAMSATGEYSQTIDGTVAGTQAAIVSIINRVNQIYEEEVAVRMILVNNNSILIYLDGTTDPFTDSDTGLLMDENQALVDSDIGSANYDVSEVLCSTGSGQASGSSVCNAANKGRGTSSIRGSGPLDNQSVYHTAHELGHQYGAGHSWNGAAGNCNNDNYMQDSAYEPGSGTTIMGYPGTCSTDNIRIGKEAYFHRISLNEMQGFIGSGLGCATLAASGNNPPAINAGTDIYVPINTPFKLNATSTDPDGDTVFYCWEQFEKGTARTSLGSADNGTDPQWRSFFPTSNSARYFPANPAAPASTAEVPFTIPNLARVFQVTARDYRSGGGGTNNDEMIVNTMDAPATPFQLTVGNSSLEVWTGLTKLITWDVAGTDTLPYNIFNVNIMLSTDSGATYPYMLKANTPNDGSELVNLPNINSDQVRIRLEPTGSGIYDISDADITVGGHIGVNPAVADFGVVCPADLQDRVLTVFNSGPGDLTITGITRSGSTAFTLVPDMTNPQPVLPATIAPGGHVEFTIRLTAPNTPGAITSTFNIASTDLSQPTISVTATATVGESNIATVIANTGNFGEVCLGSFKDMAITVTNSGDCNLIISGITTNIPDFVIPNVSSYPVTVIPGNSIQVPVRFQPLTVDSKFGVITINSNDPDTPAKQVNVFGDAPGGKISVTPCPIEFGLVCPEDLQSRAKTMNVCNVGTCPLTISNISLSNTEFTLMGVPTLPVTIQSGSCISFDIKFTPSSIGPKSATLSINSDDPDNPTVECEATGETVASVIGAPFKMAFQPTVITTVAHCPNAQPLAITGTGNCNVTITTMTITGPNADSFSLTGLPTTTGSLQLGPGEQLGDGDLKVQFLPSTLITERFHTAQVNVGYISDPFSLEETTATIHLAGEAVQNGFRMLVRAGGVPVDNVLQIDASIKGAKNSGGSKKNSKLKIKNATLRTVTAPTPFEEDLSFQYHAEFGGLTNPDQTATGEVLMKVKFQIGKKKVTRTVKFQNIGVCTFNGNVVVDF